MEMSYGQLEMTLLGHFRIHPDKVSTFRSRIKQLQRLQFPPGVNVGRGTKMTYTSEHLFMLVTAFELIGSGLTAQLACTIVTDHWSEFSAGFALQAIGERRYPGDNEDAVFAFLVIRSFYELQFEKVGEAEHSNVYICDHEGLGPLMQHRRLLPNHTKIIVSTGSILESVLRVAREQSGIKDATISSVDFNGWLPRENPQFLRFASAYPDRSNLEVRRYQHKMFKNDPDSLTEKGEREAAEFIANGYAIDDML